MACFILVCLYLIKIVLCGSNIWQNYEFDSGVGNREEVFIEKIVAQENITVNGSVQKWIRGVNCPDYAVGIGMRELFIMHLGNRNNNNDNALTDIDCNRFELMHDIQTVLLFSYYNFTSRFDEIILVCALGKEFSSEIRWYKLNDNFTVHQQEPFWSWIVQNPVVHLTYSHIENKLIIIHKTDENVANIDIYQISLENRPKFSIIQTIPLESPTDNSALNFDGQTIFLSLPQRNHVRILKYHKHSFIPYKNITCTSVEHILAFHIGIKSYLAIDGLNAGIYQFARRTLIKQQIDQGHLDGANYWLSIPTNHEHILLVQKNISHDTFSSLMLEVVYKSGDETFSFHEETICEYLGESFVGLNCITDENYSLGIRNGVVLTNGDCNAVVLSHSDGGTAVFKVNIGRKDVISPLNRRMEQLRSQRKRIEEALEVIKMSSEKIVRDGDVVKQNWNIKPEKLVKVLSIGEIINAIEDIDRKIQENAVKLSNQRFDTIIINGLLEVHGDSKIKHLQTNSDLQTEINDIARFDHIGRLTGHKQFTNLQTANLTFDTINGIAALDLKHIGDFVEVTGDVVFEHPVIINGNVNSRDNLISGVDLKMNVVDVLGDVKENIRFDNLEVLGRFTAGSVNKYPIHNKSVFTPDESRSDDMIFDQLYLPGNVTMKYVNNKDLDGFLKSLCFINHNTYLPGTINITKKTTLINKSTTKLLNSLRFPDDFVLDDAQGFTKFTGRKHFNTLKAKEITTTFLNGIEPEDIVTLSQDQDINGKMIFDKLEIAEGILVGGKISGGNNSNVFISNPTIIEANKILANINFKSLEITGNLTILNHFNSSIFEDKMKAVVYKDDEFTTLSHQKRFLNGFTVQTNLVTNLINGILIDKLISKHTNALINARKIDGSIEINNLQISGLVNNCNITELDSKTVKLSGDQFLTSKFTFSDELLISNTLDIKKSINGLEEVDLLFTNGDRIVNRLDVKNIHAQKIVFEADVQFGLLPDFNLADFEAERLSYSMDQYLTSNIQADLVEADLINASFINNHAHFDLFNPEGVRNKILDLFFSGKLVIKNLIVDETINANSINDVNINELFSECIWAEGTNVYKQQIVFLDNIFCNNIFIDSFNNVPFNDFVNNIVYKNESAIKLGGLKNFIGGFHVKNYIDTKYINNIKIGNVLRKSGEQIISAPIEIIGNTEIGTTEIAETINGVRVRDFIESFDIIDDNTIKINGDVMFSRFVFIDDFNIKGSVNNQNITKTFQELVNTNKDVNFSNGTVVFEDFVNVKGNIDVLSGVNEVNMDVFSENVVYVSNDAEFDDVVTFSEHVDIVQKLYVQTDFVARFVDGVDMQSWLQNAVFINKGIIPGNVTFEHAILNGNLLTQFINGLNMSSLIPLRSDQNLNAKLLIDNAGVFNQIVVENLVNNFQLENEFDKTVMTDKDNVISSEIIFENSVVVREELNVASPVNNKNLSGIITTQTDQFVHGKLIFLEDVFLERDFVVSDGFLNDINLTDWFKRSVKKSAPFVQNLNQLINADNIIFDGDIVGEASVNKINAKILAEQVEGKRLMKKDIEEKLIDSYSDICSDVNSALKSVNQQLFTFDYLEQAQTIQVERNIRLVHKFEHLGIYYILLHEDDSCITQVFSWSEDRFDYNGHIETGIISQIITIPDSKERFFVTRSDFSESNCTIVGSNIWLFEPEDTTLRAVLNIDDQILLEESLIVKTFYGISTDNFVVEYKLVSSDSISLNKHRKWQIIADNLSFIPRGLNTGLAVVDGVYIYRLLKNDIIESDGQLGYESTYVGRVSVENNTILRDGEMIVLRTGEFNKNVMVAVTRHDNIQIYDDWNLYQEINVVNPSSLMTIDFGNTGESFLCFLEDNRKLRMFEYKGIFGFLERLSFDIDGTHLESLVLTNENNQKNHFIVAVDKNKLRMFKNIMRGNKINTNAANCNS